MGLLWIRLWLESLADPKIRSLTAVQFRIWITLLMLAGKSNERGMIYLTEDVGMSPEQIADAAALRYDPAGDDDEYSEVGPALARFESLDMISRNGNGVITVTNFAKRQWGAASSAPWEVRERVRRHRERKHSEQSEAIPGLADKPNKASVSSPVRRVLHGDRGTTDSAGCNASVTPGNDIDTDTDTDTEGREGGPAAAFAPARQERPAAAKAPPAATPPRPNWKGEKTALQGIPGYPFDEGKDRQLMDSLADAYGQLNLAAEVRAMKAWLASKGMLPVRGQSGPRQRVRRWMAKADQMAVERGERPKRPGPQAFDPRRLQANREASRRAMEETGDDGD